MAAAFASILHELLLIFFGRGGWTVGFAWRQALMESV
jgi:hypothetical protein